eukprot:EG_transcript_51324
MAEHHHWKLGAALGAAGGYKLAEHNGGGTLGNLAGGGLGAVLGGVAENGLAHQFSHHRHQYDQPPQGGFDQYGPDPYGPNQYGGPDYGDEDGNPYAQYGGPDYDAPPPKHHHKLGNVAG